MKLVNFLVKWCKYIQEKFKAEVDYSNKCIKYIRWFTDILYIKKEVNKNNITLDESYLKNVIYDKEELVNILKNIEDIKNLSDVREIMKKMMDCEEIEEIKDTIYKIDEIIIDRHITCNKLSYTKAQENGASRLLALSKMISIPMVFSRNKYIEIVNKAYENINKEDYTWEVKLGHSFLYLNSYMIPLLLKVYYYLLYLYSKNKYDNKEETFNHIEKTLKEYIKINPEYYSFKKIIIDKKDRYNFRNNLGTEAFQINVTEIIYNYRYNKDFSTKNNDIFKIMEDLNNEENMNEEIIKSKYNWDGYQFNFPFNGIYSNYQINKNEKL